MAEQRKKLIEINIKMALLCDTAYKRKHDLQLWQGLQMMRHLRYKKQESLQRPCFLKIDFASHNQDYQNNYKIINLLNQMLVYGEKTINSESHMDSKCNR
jgi:hypothetical protein